MSLKDTWKNKIDGVDDVLADDINAIANQAIENENSIQNLNTKTQENAENIQDLSLKTQKNEASIIQLNTDLIINKEEIAEHESKIENLETLRIIPKVGGSLISLPDSAEAPLQGMKIFGKTKQFSTTGKNKLPYPYYDTNKTYNGITFTDNGDGTITVNGTATATSYYNFAPADNIIPILSGSYILSSGVPNDSATKTIGCYLALYDPETLTRGTPVGTVNGSVTVTVEKDTYFDCNITIRQGFVANNLVIRPMVRPANTDDTWEPYTGGIPSPNPNYPQEITSVGEDSGSVDLKLQGKNLLNNDTSLVEEITYVGPNGNILSRNGYALHLPKGTYTVTLTDLDTSIAKYWYGVINDANGNFVKNIMLLQDTKNFTPLTFTINKGEVVYFFDGFPDRTPQQSFEKCLGICQVQLEAGSTATEYEPYKPLQSATFETPDGLRRIPNTDIRDEIDLERKVRIQRVGEYRNTGEPMTMTSAIQSADNKNIIYWNHCLRGLPAYKPNTTVAIISNYFRYHYSPSKNVYACMHATHGNSNASNFLYFSAYVEDLEYGTTYTTVKEAITAWLAKTFSEENPLIVWYPLAEPIETPLTDEEIAAYKALHTYKPNTTIYNSEGVDMEVKYVADTKLYIDNKIEKAVAELSAAIITE